MAASRAAPATKGYSAERYSKAVVIDALGGLGGFHPELPDDAPLTDGDVADARQSGLTAINVTVNEVGNGPDRYEKTVNVIGLVEHEINAHPDVFLKILRGSDLTLAKQSGRVGLIYGFQDTSMLTAISRDWPSSTTWACESRNRPTTVAICWVMAVWKKRTEA